jgi:hypothetical protein
MLQKKFIDLTKAITIYSLLGPNTGIFANSAQKAGKVVPIFFSFKELNRMVDHDGF